jgi:hypothetical protein
MKNVFIMNNKTHHSSRILLNKRTILTHFNFQSPTFEQTMKAPGLSTKTHQRIYHFISFLQVSYKQDWGNIRIRLRRFRVMSTSLMYLSALQT